VAATCGAAGGAVQCCKDRAGGGGRGHRLLRDALQEEEHPTHDPRRSRLPPQCRAAPERSSPGRGVGQGVQRVEISIQIAIMKIIMMAPLGGHRSLTAENVTAQSPRSAAAGSCRTCRRRLRSKRSPERGLFLADSCMIQFFLYCETHMHPLFRCTL
jgi:hypothetical protein